MGIFGPYAYTNKNKEKFYLHVKQKGERTLYYFSKNPADALKSLPKGFEVFENERSGLPMLRRKTAGGFLAKGKDAIGKISGK